MNSWELANILDDLPTQKDQTVIDQYIAQTTPWLSKIKDNLQKEIPTEKWNYKKEKQVYKIKAKVSFLNGVVAGPFNIESIKVTIGVRLLNTAIEWGILSWGAKENMEKLGTMLEKASIKSIIAPTKDLSAFGGNNIRTHLLKSADIRNNMDLEDISNNIVRDIIDEYQILKSKRYLQDIVQNIPVKKSITLLEIKKQIILYGPPGTGKTFNTKRYAVRLIADENV